MRAISWSRQKRYLPQPWGAMPKTTWPISQGAGRLASLAQRPAVLEAGEEPLGQFGAAREIEGVDAGRQLAQRANWRICDEMVGRAGRGSWSSHGSHGVDWRVHAPAEPHLGCTSSGSHEVVAFYASAVHLVPFRLSEMLTKVAGWFRGSRGTRTCHCPLFCEERTEPTAMR